MKEKWGMKDRERKEGDEVLRGVRHGELALER